jgi:lipoate-protein ligase A
MRTAFPKTTWRLIRTPAANGAWNMALDEALRENVAKGRSLPTLRLFSWAPPCFSLGYAQFYQEVDLERLRLKGWHLVRRPTGGKAILHCNEITYSITAPLSEPRVEGTVLDSYCRLSKGLLQALVIMGVPAKADSIYSKDKASPSGPVCFEVPSNYEITVQGKKILGSAQSRRGEGLLQHGSLPLYGDIALITDALKYASEKDRRLAAEKVRLRATNLTSVLGYEPDYAEVENAFIQGFRTELDLEFAESEPTQEEKELAEKLVFEKYGNDSWNIRT